MHVIGSIIAAVVRMSACKRAAKIPKQEDYLVRQIDYGAMGLFPCHAVVNEAYDFQAEATTYPIEDGSLYSDHVLLRPTRLTVTMEISNYDGLGYDANQAITAFNAFQTAFEERQPIGLLTTHSFLDNMLMVSFQPENTAPEWGRLTVRVTFQQVKQATLQTQRFSAARVQGDISGGESKSLGPKTPLSASDAKKVGKKAVKVVTKAKDAFSPLTNQLFKNYGILQ